jgi:biopolymer transport protein ExbD
VRYLRKRRRRNPNAVIDITSLIDAAFILIIFLLVSTSFKKKDHAYSLALPTAGEKEVIIELERHTIYINEKDEIRFISPSIPVVATPSPVKPDVLKQQIEALIQSEQNAAIRFVVDRNVRYQTLISTIGTVQKAGAQNIQFQYELSKDNP